MHAGLAALGRARFAVPHRPDSGIRTRATGRLSPNAEIPLTWTVPATLNPQSAVLPISQMIELYTFDTSNGQRAAISLEESGLL